MLRAFLRILIPCLLTGAILAAAVYMDSGRHAQNNQDNREETTLSIATEQPEASGITEESTAPADTQPVPADTMPPETVPEETEPEQNSYVLTFMGDCTFGATEAAYYAQQGFVKTVGEDYGYPFENVRAYLENDDFTFLNLEGPLCDEGYPRGEQYSFRGPSSFVNILTQNSVEAVSLANNHIMDFGEEGYNTTRQVLEEADISYAEKDATTIITLDSGLTIGLYGTTYGKVEKQTLIAQISAMKDQGVDVIIYAAHWGVEGSYDINREQQELAYAAIDAGAHIVYGSHPHVLQPIEEYNGGAIFYSLGNFSFGGNGAPRDFDTAIIQQELLVEENGSVSLGERTIVPCSISSVPLINNYQPTPYAAEVREYERVLEKLSGTYDGPNLSIE